MTGAAAYFLNGGFGDFDMVFGLLVLEFGDEVFLNVRGEVHFACGGHVGGVGVDGFFPGEVADGGEGFGGLEDFVVEAGFLGFDGGGQAGDAGADDGDVEGFRRWGGFSEIVFCEDVLDGASSCVGREFEEGDAGEVADDADAGEVAGAIAVGFGCFLDFPGRPFAMEPVEVGLDGGMHGWVGFGGL